MQIEQVKAAVRDVDSFIYKKTLCEINIRTKSGFFKEIKYTPEWKPNINLVVDGKANVLVIHEHKGREVITRIDISDIVCIEVISNQ